MSAAALLTCMTKGPGSEVAETGLGCSAPFPDLRVVTWDEPFGLVMIEALACCTPCSRSLGGAAPETVDDARTGFPCAG
jgi:hypothetical protein